MVDMDKDGNFRSLFHSVGKTRLMPKGVWLKAKRKLVCEGSNGTKYLSGFHVLPTLEECKEYGKKFKLKEHRRIISVYCKNLRQKKHSKSNVKLAGWMLIPETCEIYDL